MNDIGDDNTTYALKILFKCFSENQMKTNPNKCNFLSSMNSAIGRTVGHEKIASSKCAKLVGVKFDVKLNFDSHIHDVFKKAGKMLNATSWITPWI